MTLKSLFATFTFTILLGFSSIAQSAIGVWKTIDDETDKAKSHVEIYEQNGKLHGKIIELIDPETEICSSCSGDRKNQKLIGMKIMWDMKKSGDVWKSGKIFSPTKDTTYKCKIWLDDSNTLKVRGYYYGFYRTQTWYRIK